MNICSSIAFFWKLISKHTCLDILTRVFGYLITRVWICSLPGIKEYPCDSNEWKSLCIINEFQETCSHTLTIFLKTGRPISYLRAAMSYLLFHTRGFCLVRNFKILSAKVRNLWIDFIKMRRIVAQQCMSSRSISPVME